MAIPVAVTIDIHPNDAPSSILRCNDFFAGRNIRVTYLVSTSILQNRGVLPVLKTLQQCGHELGTHAHNHCSSEIRALMSGEKGQLAFLRHSKSCFEDFFGESPASFRSPVWCGIGKAALDELERLGYKVDCSSTPQRPGLLSSMPWESPWLFSSREVHWIRRGLLEVPTSTFLLPLASPSFAMLRGKALGLLKLLIAETRHASRKVLVISFDINDFDQNRSYIPPAHSWRQLIPAKYGGFQWRYWLRTYSPTEIFSVVAKLFAVLEKECFLTLRNVFDLNFQLSDINPEYVSSTRIPA
jgi:hypothetical protein